MRRVISYIDGFNLYNGLKAGYGRKYLWLDLERLSASLLQDDQKLVSVRYFTAPVRNQPPALRRQQKYWNALRAHADVVSIELGRFQEKSLNCRGCGRSWKSYDTPGPFPALADCVERAANLRRVMRPSTLDRCTSTGPGSTPECGRSVVVQIFLRTMALGGRPGNCRLLRSARRAHRVSVSDHRCRNRDLAHPVTPRRGGFE